MRDRVLGDNVCSNWDDWEADEIGPCTILRRGWCFIETHHIVALVGRPNECVAASIRFDVASRLCYVVDSRLACGPVCTEISALVESFDTLPEFLSRPTNVGAWAYAVGFLALWVSIWCAFLGVTRQTYPIPVVGPFILRAAGDIDLLRLNHLIASIGNPSQASNFLEMTVLGARIIYCLEAVYARIA